MAALQQATQQLRAHASAGNLAQWSEQAVSEAADLAAAGRPHAAPTPHSLPGMPPCFTPPACRRVAESCLISRCDLMLSTPATKLRGQRCCRIRIAHLRVWTGLCQLVCHAAETMPCCTRSHHGLRAVAEGARGGGCGGRLRRAPTPRQLRHCMAAGAVRAARGRRCVWRGCARLRPAHSPRNRRARAPPPPPPGTTHFALAAKCTAHLKYHQLIHVLQSELVRKGQHRCRLQMSEGKSCNR